MIGSPCIDCGRMTTLDGRLCTLCGDRRGERLKNAKNVSKINYRQGDSLSSMADKIRGAMDIEKRWRDGRGVVHRLAPHSMPGLSMTDGIVWAPACGQRYDSKRECDPSTPITCMRCLGAERRVG